MLTVSHKILRTLVLAGGLVAAVPAFASDHGDPKAGENIARLWCANCHTVAADQQLASPDAPSFASLANRPDITASGLSVFLVNPHPPMPDMNLTRNEIADVIAYIMSKGDN